MSRRLPPSQRPRVHVPPSEVASYQTVPSTSALANPIVKYGGGGGSHRGGHPHPHHQYKYHQASDTEPPTFSDVHSYYEYSDDNSSTRLPYYDDVSTRRHSRQGSSSERTHSKRYVYPSLPVKDTRRVFPGVGEAAPSCPVVHHQVTTDTRRLRAISRLSDRPHTPASSGVGSATVDGCGGHCVAFESVCYYLLQVTLTMGILVGASLCIAGAVLRRSRARDLQVLMYIGALVALVSAFLLGIQYSARREQRLRRKTVRAAHRAIPLLPVQHHHHQQQHHQQQQQSIVLVQENRAPRVLAMVDTERQGIPWWRRDDITINRV